MTTITTLLTELIDAKTRIDNLLEPILVMLKNKKFNLNERWSAYTTLVSSGIFNKNEIFGDGLIDVLDQHMDALTLYDYFYIEKGQTTNFTELYDRLMDADPKFDLKLVRARETNLAAWQEEVLQSGYSSFTFDW